MYKLTGQSESGKDWEFLLADPSITVGRAVDCQAVIDDPSVSSHHARLTLESDKVYIEDSNSRNGVLVNGEKIARKQQLQSGDMLQLGLVKLVLLKIEEETDERTIFVENTSSSGTIIMETATEESTTPDLTLSETEDRTRLADLAQDAAENTAVSQSTAGGTAPEIDSNKTLLWGEGQAETDQSLQFAKLFLVIPQGKGREYPLDKVEISLGRTEDNNIILDHPSVSRSHAKIILNEGDYYLVDLGSANGTLVNGSPAQDTKLQKGDQVQIGLVKGRFIDRGEVVSYQELEKSLTTTENKLQTLMTWITASPLHMGIAAIGALLLILIALIPITKKSPPAGEKPGETSDHMEKELLRKKSLDLKLSLGKEYYKAQVWDKADFAFKDVLSLDPGNEEAKKYLKQIESERASQKTPETVAKPAKETKERKISAALKKPEEIQNAPKPKLNPKPEPKSAVKSTEKTAPQEINTQKLLAEALADYQKGDISVATNILKKVGTKSAEEYINKMEQAQLAYNNGLEKYQGGQNVAAFKEWQQVLGIDQELLGGKKSGFAQQISKYMADEYYKEGLAYYNKGMFKEAFEYWGTGLNLNPEQAQIKEEMAKLSLKAKQLYQEAYILESANPQIAKKKWQEVLTIVPPDNEYYKKAQQKLQNY